MFHFTDEETEAYKDQGCCQVAAKHKLVAFKAQQPDYRA
jgi:hypothetical protein